MQTSAELKATLHQYFGGGDVYRHSLNPNFRYTEGAKAFAEGAEAYWFLDIVPTDIAELQQDEGFIQVILNVKDGSAFLTLTTATITSFIRSHSVHMSLKTPGICT